MPIDQATLGERLRNARESRGITQQQAADALGLPRTAIVQIEAGNRGVSSLELSKLAELYKRDIVDFLAEKGPSEEEDLLVVVHRIAPGLEDEPEVVKEVERCFEICKIGTELEQILERPQRSGPPEYRLPTPRNAGEAVVQGCQVAAQERQRLGLGDAPIPDIAELLNGQDIWACSIRLPDQMSGLFLKNAFTGLIVLVNEYHAEQRKRFSYAHEYAHALLDRELNPDGTVSERKNASELTEKRANSFAAAFLMPPGGVDHFLKNHHKGQPSRWEPSIFDVANEDHFDAQVRPAPGSQELAYQDVALIANYFGVSYQAACYQLNSLRHISSTQCQELLKQDQMAQRYLKLLELLECEEENSSKKKQKMDRELITQIVHLAIEAYRREEVSRGRILEIAQVVGLPPRDLLDLAEASKAA